MSVDYERELDEFDLELQAAGAELDPALIAALDGAEHLGPARDEIAAMASWWAVQRPPLPLPEAPIRRRRWPWTAAIVAVAAAAAMVALIRPPEPAFRARGEVELDVHRVRAGATVDARTPVRAGDRLSVAVVLDAKRYVHVATLQQDGAVSLLASDRLVESGARFELPGQLMLDGYDGREWLVVMATPWPLSPVAIEDQVKDLLPEPHEGKDLWVVELTRGQAPR